MCSFSKVFFTSIIIMIMINLKNINKILSNIFFLNVYKVNI